MTEHEVEYPEILGQTERYIARNFALDSSATRLIINTLQATQQMGYAERRKLLEDIFDGCGFNDQELKAMAEGISPAHVNVPVYATLKLPVKAWVAVPAGSSEERIKEEAIEAIISEHYEADDSIEIEQQDIEVYKIDHDGAQLLD